MKKIFKIAWITLLLLNLMATVYMYYHTKVVEQKQINLHILTGKVNMALAESITDMDTRISMLEQSKTKYIPRKF